jgi:hypothetical protein
LLFNFRAVAPAEGATEEFQVGDTCNASAAQKQLREVILLRGTVRFWLIFRSG